MRVVAFCLCLIPALALGADVAGIKQAIAELGGATYATRQAGVEHLLKLADDDHQAVLDECVVAYRQTDDPEVRIRMKSALQLIVDKHLYRAPRGFLGIRLNNVIVNGGGRIIINNVNMPANSIWVAGVIDNTAAAKAGLQANDFIASVDGRAELKMQEFTQYIASKKPGDHVKLQVMRGAATNDLDVVLGDLPEEQRQQILTDEAGREYFKKWQQEHLGKKPETDESPVKKPAVRP